MADWSSAGITQGRNGALEQVSRLNHREEEVLVAEGDAVERTCGREDREAQGCAGVLVRRLPAPAERQGQGLETRLAQAEHKLAALTPASGRGNRQSTAEATLVAAIDRVLKAQRVEGLLRLAWAQQLERHTHDMGRG